MASRGTLVHATLPSLAAAALVRPIESATYTLGSLVSALCQGAEKALCIAVNFITREVTVVPETVGGEVPASFAGFHTSSPGFAAKITIGTPGDRSGPLTILGNVDQPFSLMGTVSGANPPTVVQNLLAYEPPTYNIQSLINDLEDAGAQGCYFSQLPLGEFSPAGTVYVFQTGMNADQLTMDSSAEKITLPAETGIAGRDLPFE